MSCDVEVRLQITVNKDALWSDIKKELIDLDPFDLSCIEDRLSSSKFNKVEIDIDFNASYRNFDTRIGNLSKALKSSKLLSGIMQVTVDGVDSPKVPFGINGTSIMVESIDRDIANLMKIRSGYMRALKKELVRSMQAEGETPSGSMMNDIAIRTAAGYDPRSSALLALSREAAKTIDAMRDGIESLLQGDINIKSLRGKMVVDISDWNNSVENVTNVCSATEKRLRRP